MGKTTGFLEYARQDAEKVEAESRVGHYGEFQKRVSLEVIREQGARCMNCGVPFCHTGCPLGNRIPDWNDLVYRDRWSQAWATLSSTNNFPEVTGRICPAPCEAACVVNINDDPVTIETIEKEIADKAFESGWVVPQRPEVRSGRKVAVVGSGPAGLACAQQLARAGHDVTVLERADRIGGLLRYGIPDFKLDKGVLDLRMAQMREEGVSFRTGVEIGKDVSVDALRATHDAVVMATGSTKARELPLPGRELGGVHLAMDFLPQQNKVVAGDEVEGQILASGKKVVILGGGDTGSDCLGTSIRQGAQSITQIELMPRPPEEVDPSTPWPLWPMVMRTSSSQEEGGERDFAVLTKRFLDDGAGHVRALEAVRVEWAKDESGKWQMSEVAGSEFEIECDLVLLALGFVGPEPAAWQGTALETDARGNLRADTEYFGTSVPGVFACGDARRGQSLVVWAIWEGRQAALAVDSYLVGESQLVGTPMVASF